MVCEVAANIVRVECVCDAARRDTPYRRDARARRTTKTNARDRDFERVPALAEP